MNSSTCKGLAGGSLEETRRLKVLTGMRPRPFSAPAVLSCRSALISATTTRAVVKEAFRTSCPNTLSGACDARHLIVGPHGLAPPSGLHPFGSRGFSIPAASHSTSTIAEKSEPA